MGIKIGDVVIVDYDGERVEYQIGEDSNPLSDPPIISIKTALGKALRNKEIDDDFSVQTPGGVRNGKVISFDVAPEVVPVVQEILGEQDYGRATDYGRVDEEAKQIAKNSYDDINESINWTESAIFDPYDGEVGNRTGKRGTLEKGSLIDDKGNTFVYDKIIKQCAVCKKYIDESISLLKIIHSDGVVEDAESKSADKKEWLRGTPFRFDPGKYLWEITKKTPESRKYKGSTFVFGQGDNRYERRDAGYWTKNNDLCESCYVKSVESDMRDREEMAVEEGERLERNVNDIEWETQERRWLDPWTTVVDSVEKRDKLTESSHVVPVSRLYTKKCLVCGNIMEQWTQCPEYWFMFNGKPIRSEESLPVRKIFRINKNGVCSSLDAYGKHTSYDCDNKVYQLHQTKQREKVRIDMRDYIIKMIQDDKRDREMGLSVKYPIQQALDKYKELYGKGPFDEEFVEEEEKGEHRRKIIKPMWKEKQKTVVKRHIFRKNVSG